MDEREANIDLVFRNGLKDYEVLPPPEVWDKVRPAASKRFRPFILIRAAALIAVVLTISFFAYTWNREFSTRIDNSVTAMNVEVAQPQLAPSGNAPFSSGTKENIPVYLPQKTLIADTPENTIVSGNEKTDIPEAAYLQESFSLAFNRASIQEGPFLSVLNPSLKKSIGIAAVEPQYIPESSTTKGTERWSIGAMASPTYYSTFNSGNDQLSRQLMAVEQPLMSYSGGVALSYKINKKFSIQTGLYYSSLGQEVDGINSFGGFHQYDYTKGDHNFEVLTANGTVYTSNPDVFLISEGMEERILSSITSDIFDPKKASLQYINNTLLQNFSYLELPVILRYKFIDKAIDFNLIGGVSYNLLVGNSVYTRSEGGRYPIGRTEGLNLLTLSSSLGMGMEYSFSDKLSLNLEPTFRYYLNPFNEITGSKNHPYSFGIFSGISYKF